MASYSEKPPDPLPEEDSAQDLRAARSLGEYLRRSDANGAVDIGKFLAEYPDLAPHLAQELETLEEIGSILGERDQLVDFGDFEIICEAGRGAMGIVYEARQISLDRRVALKILPASLLADSKAVARFHREAKVAAKLSHPNVVGVYAMGVEDGTPYYAMEFAEGRTLSHILHEYRSNHAVGEWSDGKPGKPAVPTSVTTLLAHSGSESVPGMLAVDPSVAPDTDAGTPAGDPVSRTSGSYFHRIAELFAGASAGLHHAHANAIIHRDLKPSNLILDSKGRLRILDFGVAWMEGEVNLTLTRERVGTPLYMSPEQARDPPGTIGPGSDIYSLGASLYEMIVWRPPLTGRSCQETLHRIVNEDPIPVRRINPEVPKDLETIVMKCLRKDPQDRYGTSEALSQDLRRFVRGDPIEARPQPRVEKLVRRVWRSRRRILEVAGILFLLGALGLVYYMRHLDDYDERDKKYAAQVNGAVVDILSHQLLAPTASLAAVDWESVPFPVPLDGSRNLDRPSDLLESGPSPFQVFEAGPALRDIGPDLVEEAMFSLKDAIRIFPDRPIAYYHLARALFIRGQHDEVEEHLGRCLELDPSFLPALSLQASLLEKRGDPRAEEVRAGMARLARRHESRWPASWLAAQRAILERQWARAAQAFDRLHAQERGQEEPYLGHRIETLLGRGVAHLKALELDGALQAFGAGELAWPERIEPRLFVGKVYYLKKNERKAEAIFRELFEKATAKTGEANGNSDRSSSPDRVAHAVAATYAEVGDFEHALDWTNLMSESLTKLLMKAEFLRRLERFDKALQTGLRALRRAPDDPAPLITIGGVLMDQGEPGNARSWYELACQLAPKDPRPVIALGICLEAQGSLEEAAEYFERAKRLDPGHGQAHYNLGRILSQQGKISEAIRSFEKAIEVDPGNGLALNNLGTLHDRQGRQEEARLNYEQATQVSPELGLAHYNLAWVYHRERRYAEAVREYRKAIDWGLDEAVVHSNLGTCLLFRGRREEAISQYRKALEPDSTSFLTHHDYGVALDHQGRLTEAIEEYRRAAELAPQRVDVLTNLGYALDRGGQVEEAVARYRQVLDLDPKWVRAHNYLTTLTLRENWPVPEGPELEEEIVRLEDAQHLPNASRHIARLLEKYRKALFPRLASYASVEALLDSPEILVAEDATWRYFYGAPRAEEEPEWKRQTFDDASWNEGRGGFGFPKLDGITTVLGDMRGSCSSVYLRQRFSVPVSSAIETLQLLVRADDGFVAYLNGEEIARRNAGAKGERFGPEAVADREESNPWKTRVFRLDPERLRSGANVIAVQGLNISRDDGDFALHLVLNAAPLSKAGRDERVRRVRRALSESSLPSDATRLTYLEGRLLQLRGQHQEAAVRFREVIALDGSRPEPFLRLAECLREQQDAVSAERVLVRALESGLTGFDQIWHEWLRLSMTDLSRTSAETVVPFREMMDEVSGEPEGSVMECLWLLEELAAGETIRINCGGQDYSSEGVPWSRDRFFRGGFQSYLDRLESTELEDAALYRTERYFAERGSVLPGYRMPLPKGDYRVTLHFIEGHFRTRGSRRFDVRLEGESSLVDYEPLERGFGMVGVFDFEIPVNDGALDIDFARQVENPQICAIEVEKLGG